MSSITVRPLSESLVQAAYALVRLDRPAVAIEEWRLEAEQRLAEQARIAGGVLLALDPAGRILGLLEYSRPDGQCCGFRVLRLIAPGITRQQVVELESQLREEASQRGVRLLSDARSAGCR